MGSVYSTSTHAHTVLTEYLAMDTGGKISINFRELLDDLLG